SKKNETTGERTEIVSASSLSKEASAQLIEDLRIEELRGWFLRNEIIENPALVIYILEAVNQAYVAVKSHASADASYASAFSEAALADAKSLINGVLDHPTKPTTDVARAIKKTFEKE